MTAYLSALLWGASILISMAGWGDIVHRVLQVRVNTGWARRASVGLAFSACVGGLFDLFGVVSRTAIVGFLAIGCFAKLVSFARASANRSTLSPRATGPALLGIAGLTLSAVLLSIRVAGSLIVLQPPTGMQPGSFNPFDDFQAYIVYPLKMIETGSMGADPFSIRRTPSHAFGGNAFLQTFVLAVLPVQSLRIVDVGLGTILIVSLLWSYLSQLGTTRAWKAFVILVFLAIPPPLGNITSLLIPVALFLSLFLCFLDAPEDVPRLSRGALIGSHVAALGVLKTSLMPAALAFAGVQAGFVVLRAASKRRAAFDALSWFAFAGVAALPWLLDARRWTGTLVPGTLAAYFADLTRVAAIQQVTGWPFLIGHLRELPRTPYVTLAVLSGILLFKPIRRATPDAFWSLMAGAALGTLGITLAVAGAVNDIQRFIYPFWIAALLVALALVGAAVSRLRASSARAVVHLIAGAAMVSLVFATIRQTVSMYKFNVVTVARAVRGETLVAPALAARYRAMQSAVPPSETVLANMDFPFLFDFRRNTVFLIDLPGSASLAPGMPFFQGSHALATYLTSHGIRYVAYDYATGAGTPTDGGLGALARDDRHPAAQSLARLIIDFHDNLEELGRSDQHVFDDRTAFVLDLARPTSPEESR